MGKNPKVHETYIHRLATTMAGQISINFAEYDRVASQKLGAEVHSYHSEEIRKRICEMSLATRAKIAAQGKAKHQQGGVSLEDVHRRSSWVDGSVSGEEIINRVAVTAIVAALCDLMIADRHVRGIGMRPGPEDMGHGRGMALAQSAYIPGLDGNDRRL
jgi:hypothetical protein